MLVVPVAVIWLAALYQGSVVARGGGGTATRWHVVGFTALAVALTINLPPVYTGLDRLAGEPNLAELIVHALALTAGWAAHGAIVTTLHEAAGARARIVRSAVVLAITVAAMAVFFALAPVDSETLDFTVTYATAPYVSEYWLAYLAFAAYALLDIAVMAWRYRRSAGSLVGAGLRMLALGAAFGLVYVALKAAYLACSRWFDLQFDDRTYTTTSGTAMVLCAVLCVVGATFPRWADTGLRALSWVGRYRTYQQLRPLWVALTDASPQVVFVSPQRRWIDVIDPRQIDFRLYRRVIEIRDGQLELRSYTTDATAREAESNARAQGHTGAALEAATEAGILAAALVAKRGGEPIASWRRVEQSGSTDVRGEAQRLVMVASFFRGERERNASRRDEMADV